MTNNIKEIVSKMTVFEKASMVSGKDVWHLDDISRLGVPSVMVTDGPHGLRKQFDASDNLGINESIKAVCFPTAVGTAASFDKYLLRNIGETLGEECQAENISVLLGPAVNIKRSPLCGRNFEYFSEDPFLSGELAQSYINGVQSKNIGTSIKHFAINNQEKRRMTISAVVDERTQREIYFPAFEIAVKKSQPWTVMCSYNKINGVYSSENPYLLQKILRDEWGFKGYVMTDWGACNNRVKGVQAGLDLEMPSSGRINTNKILNAINNGEMNIEVLETACERILEKTFEYESNKSKSAVFDRDADHKKAAEAAKQSMVLLKNEDNILPLSKDKKIAFIGEFAINPRYQGGGSSHVNAHRVVSACNVVRDNHNVRYAKGFAIKSNTLLTEELQQAINLAKSSDVAVIFAGLPESYESEGFDRNHLNLPETQNILIEKIAEVQPNTVVVLHNGSPVLMPWLGKVKAVLESYLAGEGVGEGQVALLFGDANPSAKLAETFPLALSETPCYKNFPGNQLTVEYREGVYVGYRYYDTAQKNVLFPFGHGLSYTTFEYKDIKLSKKKINENVELTVSFKIKNTGKMDGAEIAQLYVAPQNSQMFRPVKELKGFEKVFLKAGEEKEVSIQLDSRSFAYYNVDIKDWYCESGKYDILIGASSRDIRLNGTVELKNSKELDPPCNRNRFPSYFNCTISSVSDEEFSALLGFPIPDSTLPGNTRFTLDHSISDAQNTKWGRRISKAVRFVGKQTSSSTKGLGDSGDMLLNAVLECPIHSTIAMSQDMLSEEMGNAIVDVLNNEQVLPAIGTLVKGGINAAKKALRK